MTYLSSYLRKILGIFDFDESMGLFKGVKWALKAAVLVIETYFLARYIPKDYIFKISGYYAKNYVHVQ